MSTDLLDGAFIVSFRIYVTDIPGKRKPVLPLVDFHNHIQYNFIGYT